MSGKRKSAFNFHSSTLSSSSARCTSAAPGFFKPYNGGGGLEWLDGGLTHNNPVEVALEECKIFNEQSGGKPLIDLMLSLGTGREREERDSPALPRELALAEKAKPWLKLMYTTIQNQVRLNLRTDWRWSQTKLQQTPDIQSRMHRINPDLGYQPPTMDDVAQVEKMYNIVKGDSTKGALRDQILEVACNLVSHMFFFQKTKEAARPPGSQHTSLPGVIACRIRNGNPKLNDLGNFIKKYSCDPHAAVFRIRTFQEATDTATGKSTDSVVHIPFTSPPGSKQNQWWKFQCPEQTIMVENDSTLIHIDLNLENARWKSKWFTISGFPRQLMKADYGSLVKGPGDISDSLYDLKELQI
jgi:hypothetical protein